MNTQYLLVFSLLICTIYASTSKTQLFYLSQGDVDQSNPNIQDILSNEYNIPVKFIDW